jgi:hypothetical protein
MIEKAVVSEMACTIASDSMPANRSTGSINTATVGSPSQPSPRLASVIPSCVADR